VQTLIADGAYHTISAAASVVTLMNTGSVYVNVHTSDYTGGMFRGQVVLSPLTVSLLQAPPRVSAATGRFNYFVIDDGSYIYQITLNNQVFANIVSQNLQDKSGSSLRPLIADGVYHTLSGVGTDISNMMQGNAFVNIVTNAETLSGQIYFNTVDVVLSGLSQVPTPVVTASTGIFRIFPNLDNTAFVYQVTLTNLPYVNVTAMHLHQGLPGDNGGVLQLVIADGKYHKIGNSASLLALISNGLVYANLHTEFNPGGLLRGQVIVSAGLTVYATGAQQVPTPVVTSAYAMLSMTISNDNSFIYQLTLQNYPYTSVTGAHLH
jgi:hypothetical protein